MNALASPPHKKSGLRTALEYTGIPPSWLDKRPRLPSRNWLIFLSVTQTLVAYYVYDRHESRKIRQEYVARVKYIAEERLQPLDFPRTVTVYSAKWPGDDDWDRGSLYFRKYVKVCCSRFMSKKWSFNSFRTYAAHIRRRCHRLYHHYWQAPRRPCHTRGQ